MFCILLYVGYFWVNVLTGFYIFFVYKFSFSYSQHFCNYVPSCVYNQGHFCNCYNYLILWQLFFFGCSFCVGKLYWTLFIILLLSIFIIAKFYISYLYFINYIYIHYTYYIHFFIERKKLLCFWRSKFLYNFVLEVHARLYFIITKI